MSNKAGGKPLADSASVRAVRSAGDADYARELSDIERSERAADRKSAAQRSGIVERLIYGPPPSFDELSPPLSRIADNEHALAVLDAALGCIGRGEAFTADRKLSREIRQAVAREKGYGFTIPLDKGGAGQTYRNLASLEEELSARGLGALAVELSGELTIGAGGLIAYGSESQKSTFLPMLAEGRLMGFALTEIRVGVNAKKVSAHAEFDAASDCWRLHATGDSAKLYITSATYGALLAVVARVGSSAGDMGLFIVELPDHDIEPGPDHDYRFVCEPSGVEAFHANFNSKLTFENFPVPAHQKIDADGLEVLFFSLGLGRCMLAAMASGQQRLYAADAAHYAKHRDGVGGRLIRHELPRLALGRILGGALQARHLSHLSLQQHLQGNTLAGLRDITKSAAAGSLMDSLLCAERVVGGRSLNRDSRIGESRATTHAFSIVEGENDLILLGMVRDVTSGFTNRYMNGILAALAGVNQKQDGQPVSPDQRILRLSPMSFCRSPVRVGTAGIKALACADFWKLSAWLVRQALGDLLRLPLALVPSGWLSRYRQLPPSLRRYARLAESRLRRQRWVYLGLNLYYQLELTRAQIPMLRFGKRLEHLVSMIAVVYGASRDAADVQAVAGLQAELLWQKVKAQPVIRGIPGMNSLRRRLHAVAADIEFDRSELIRHIPPQPIPHSWGGQQTRKAET